MLQNAIISNKNKGEMMKTLDDPLSKDWTIEVECKEKTCKATLEISEDDLWHYDVGEWQNHFQYVCPHCDRVTTINRKLIPIGVQKSILRLEKKSIEICKIWLEENLSKFVYWGGRSQKAGENCVVYVDAKKMEEGPLSNEVLKAHYTLEFIVSALNNEVNLVKKDFKRLLEKWE